MAVQETCALYNFSSLAVMAPFEVYCMDWVAAKLSDQRPDSMETGPGDLPAAGNIKLQMLSPEHGVRSTCSLVS